MFEGQIWTGRAARALGLIDGLGTLHGILQARFGDKVRLPQISAARPWWQRRLGLGAAPEPDALVDAASSTASPSARSGRATGCEGSSQCCPPERDCRDSLGPEG